MPHFKKLNTYDISWNRLWDKILNYSLRIITYALLPIYIFFVRFSPEILDDLIDRTLSFHDAQIVKVVGRKVEPLEYRRTHKNTFILFHCLFLFTGHFPPQVEIPIHI